MNKRERAICARLRAVREALRWSQKDFAAELEITRDKLASLEYGRTPLRYDLARVLVDRFKISYRWLVEDKPPMRVWIPLHHQIEVSCDATNLLSRAYDEHLKAALDNRITELQILFGDRWTDEKLTGSELEHMPLAGAAHHEQLAFLLADMVHARLADMPEHLEGEFFDIVMDAVDRFYAKHAAEMAKEAKGKAS